MKLEELNLKTIITTEYNLECFLEKCLEFGVGMSQVFMDKGYRKETIFWYISNGDIGYDINTSTENFISSTENLVTLSVAIDLISKVEQPETEEDKFIEIVIDEDGNYIDDEFETEYNCFDAMTNYNFAGIKYNFAGIKYKNDDLFYMDRRVLQKKSMMWSYHPSKQDDITMVIPEKIRFFNPEYKGE